MLKAPFGNPLAQHKACLLVMNTTYKLPPPIMHVIQIVSCTRPVCLKVEDKCKMSHKNLFLALITQPQILGFLQFQPRSLQREWQCFGV